MNRARSPISVSDRDENRDRARAKNIEYEVSEPSRDIEYFQPWSRQELASTKEQLASTKEQLATARTEIIRLTQENARLREDQTNVIDETLL